MNRRLGMDVPIDTTTLTEKDFVAVVANLIDLKETDGAVDDIDHLGNRRVRIGRRAARATSSRSASRAWRASSASG